MPTVDPARLVAGATFVLLGALLVAEGLGAFDLPASAVPAIVLIGLGLALVARRATPGEGPADTPPEERT